MDLDGRAVQRQNLDRYGDYPLLLERRKHPLQHAALRPAVGLFVYAVPVAVPCGQRPPLAPVFGHIQQRPDKREVPPLDVPALYRQVSLDSVELLCCQCHVQTLAHRDISVNTT